MAAARGVAPRPRASAGALPGDINRRRGMSEETAEDKGGAQVMAKLPLANLFGYTIDLRSATAGTASFSMEFSHYAPVPAAVWALLRLVARPLRWARVPAHAAVAGTVSLASATGGERVTGLANAVLRKIAAHDYEGWVDLLTASQDARTALETRTAHPGPRGGRAGCRHVITSRAWGRRRGARS